VTIYSIDLGIDPAASHGHAGTKLSPYPMQISLCAGKLEQGAFVPEEMRSWFMLRGGDRLLVRIFDLGAQPGLLEKPQVVGMSLYDLDGREVDEQWDVSAQFVAAESAPSLSFARPDGLSYPCCLQRDGSGAPLLYPVFDPELQIRRLLTMKAEARVLLGAHKDGAPIHFKSDPEVIVSPYGGERAASNRW
jgi:hypothetical protein